MTTAEQLITDHIDVWTSAIKKKSASGRGSSSKQELYGIKKLRELILELAVRGLLVPQDASDESAEALLGRINLQKEQLVKEKKLKKHKVLEDISTEEILFEIPRTWSWSKLGDVAILKGGFAFKSSKFVSESEYQVVRMGNVRPNFLRLKEKPAYIPFDIAEDAFEYELGLGNIIITMTGTKGKRDYLYSLMVNREHLSNCKLYLNQRLCCLKLINGCSEFLNIALKAETLLNPVFAKATGTANQANIGMEAIQNWVIPVPPLEEQKRIVAKVDELMALCDQLEAEQENSLSAHQTLVETLLADLVEGVSNAADNNSFEKAWARIANHFDTLFTTEQSIEQLKQTILQLAVMGKLVPQDPEDEPASVLLEKIAYKYQTNKKGKRSIVTGDVIEHPFDLPKNWAWATFPQLGIWGRGKSKHRPRNDPALFKDGKWPLIQTGDVANSGGRITEYSKAYSDFGLEQSKLWPQGTICITIAANIADSAFLGIDACFPDSVVGLVPDDLFEGGEYFEFFIRTAKQNLTDYAPSTAQKNINLGILEQVNIPMPPLKEQMRIIKRANELISLCDQLKTQINAAQNTQLQLADAMASQALN